MVTPLWSTTKPKRGKTPTYVQLPLNEGPKEWYVQILETRAAESAQMWELGPLDHSRKRSEADPGIEVRRAAGFRPKTKGICEIAG
jgi:hypothetical protein